MGALIVAALAVISDSDGLREDDLLSKIIGKGSESESSAVSKAVSSALASAPAVPPPSIPASVSRDVSSHAADIVNVIKDGKQDDEFVKSAIELSKTHHGQDSGAAQLTKRLKEIHSLALSKKAISSVVGSAIDLSKAHGLEAKKAQKEALSIEKVLLQSKEDMANGEQIQKRAKRKSMGSNWNAFWGRKHSLVSRLANTLGTDPKAAAAAKTDSDSDSDSPSFGKPVPKASLSAVPSAIRTMWKLLGEEKGAKLSSDNSDDSDDSDDSSKAQEQELVAARKSAAHAAHAARAARASDGSSARPAAAEKQPAHHFPKAHKPSAAVAYFEAHQGSDDGLGDGLD